MKSYLSLPLGCLVALIATQGIAGETKALKPLLTQPDSILLKEDFSRPGKPDRTIWKNRQQTSWGIEDGVLRGRPSSPEYQASRQDHQGFEPRVSLDKCPNEYAIEFSIRFGAGDGTSLVPFIEFGHHFARLYWSSNGAVLLADHESVELDADPHFKLDVDKTYHVLAEVKGDEVLLQFAHGPVFYGRHPSLVGDKDGFGTAGLRGGQVELDDVTLWSVKTQPNPKWSARRSQFQTKEPRFLKTPRK